MSHSSLSYSTFRLALSKLLNLNIKNNWRPQNAFLIISLKNRKFSEIFRVSQFFIKSVATDRDYLNDSERHFDWAGAQIKADLIVLQYVKRLFETKSSNFLWIESNFLANYRFWSREISFVGLEQFLNILYY